MNVVLVKTSDFVVFLHVFAFGAATLLQCIQQFSLDAAKTCKVRNLIEFDIRQKKRKLDETKVDKRKVNERKLDEIKLNNRKIDERKFNERKLDDSKVNEGKLN